jgi:predicted metal-dependent phosphoesterase TrpH
MNTGTHYLRGVIHCHSKYSYDSATSISTYLRMARRHRLDFIILTDHDSLAGARALRAAAARTLPSLAVPLAAEYLTDEGDVIAVFVPDEIRSRNFAQFVVEARDKGALLLLPHPFVGHRVPRELAASCDLIEVANSRTSAVRNALAAELARALGKRGYAGPDAHFGRSIANAIVEVEDCGSLHQSLSRGGIRWDSWRPTERWEFGASQLLKSWKRRDGKLAMRLLASGCSKLARKAWGAPSAS